MIWLLALAFALIGAYFAWTQRFERWAGQGIEHAAPIARRVIPAPAKRVLRKSREHLPVYGETGAWLARKGGSVVYFGIVGLFVLKLRKRRPASLGQTLAVTVTAGVAMSTIIEVLEWPFGEAFGSEMFDLACGAAGGLISGLLARWLRKT